MLPHIYVCPLSQLRRAAEVLRPSHVITLLDPDHAVETPEGIDPERHLRLGMHDVPVPRVDATAPGEKDVARIIDFVAGWDRRQPMLIHCWAGVSRSTAAAFITLCIFNESGRELALARHLRARAPHAQPNRLIVQHADRMLKREGRMIRAVELLGPAQVVWEGELFGLPLNPTFEAA